MVLLWLVILKRVVVSVRLLMVALVVLGLVVILNGQVAESELAQRFGVMGRQHQAEVIDAGRRWRRRWQGLRHLAMHVATEDERDRLASRMTFPVHVRRVRSSGSKRSSTRRPISASSTAYRLPVSETEAVLVTRRMTDQRKASRSSDGSTAWRGPWRGKRWIGVRPVSACTRVLHICSAQAMKRSWSCWKLAMPWASASSRNRSRI